MAAYFYDLEAKCQDGTQEDSMEKLQTYHTPDSAEEEDTEDIPTTSRDHREELHTTIHENSSIEELSLPLTQPMEQDEEHTNEEETDTRSPNNHTTAQPTQDAEHATSAKTGTGFRLGSKKMFLTFPQNSTTKEIAFKRIQEKYSNDLDWVIIAQETHQDQSFHLHIGLALKTKLETRDPKVFDWITNKHGSYEGMKSVKKSVEYFYKQDPEPKVWGIDTKAILQKRNARSDLIARELLDGKPLNELIHDFPGYALTNLTKLTRFEQYAIRERKRSRITKKIPIYSNVDGTTETTDIVKWLNVNIRRERSFKSKQLWIYSDPPNLGKTSLIRFLEEHLSVHHLMKWEDFDDNYQDDSYDIIVADEFEGQRKLGWMNELLQGGTMPLRRKGEQYIKKNNLPILIASNPSPNSCYKNCSTSRIGTLLSRLKVIEIQQFIQISTISWIDE